MKAKNTKRFIPFTDWAAYGFPNLVVIYKEFKNDTRADCTLRDFIIGMYPQTYHGASVKGRESFNKETLTFDWIQAIYDANKSNPELTTALFELVKLPTT